MNLSRISRLLHILGLLQAGPGYNVDALARECGVSRRTIFRDLDTLRQAGVPVGFDAEQQRYKAGGATFLPPTNFTSEEALSLIVLCHELGDHGRLPFYGPARSAALKLESSLPSGLREKLRDMTGAIEIKLQPNNSLQNHAPIYQQLVDAVAGRCCVRIAYDSLTEWKEIRTKLCPYRMLFSRRSWYVIGRSSLHRATRTFNVGRVRTIEPLEETYKIPRGFSVDRYLRKAWHLIASGRDQKVVVRFQKMVAQNVAEVSWHKTQQIKWNADGSLDFTVVVSGLDEISWWILGYGDQAEVLQPQALRDIVSQRARRMLQRYDNPS